MFTPAFMPRAYALQLAVWSAIGVVMLFVTAAHYAYRVHALHRMLKV